uniref:Proliferating cell nuclear antigen PCNA N-terminal domain-containing protein n=1 Tax=viral metagenome TaxID=1070528 RepID=A0A6C0HH86_9ZZZZ
MKIVIKDSVKASKFSNIIQHLKNITDNVSFYFRPAGLYIQCMDGNHCCLFECTISATWFDDYSFVAETDQATIGITLLLFHKVINVRHESQTLELEVTADYPNHILVHFIGSEDGKFDKHFQLSLVSIEYEPMEPTPIDTTVDLTMDGKTLCELVNQLMIFDDVLVFTFKEDIIYLLSTGSEGSMKVDIEIEDVKEYAIAEDTILTQAYSLKYIQLMCQFNKLSSEIKMGFSNCMPMTMKYELSEDSYVMFHLAPKITDIDND